MFKLKQGKGGGEGAEGRKGEGVAQRRRKGRKFRKVKGEEEVNRRRKKNTSNIPFLQLESMTTSKCLNEGGLREGLFFGPVETVTTTGFMLGVITTPLAILEHNPYTIFK